MYGTTWLPNPDDVDFMGALTRPVRDMVIGWFAPLGDVAGPTITIVFGALAILLVVKYLGKLLKLLMVGRARHILTRAAGGNEYLAMGTGLGATFITQSSTITASILVPFAGAGILTTKQLYPVTVGANIGTTFTALLAAFALFGEPGAKLGLQAAFVHLLYNLLSVLVIYVPPGIKNLPLRSAEWLARIAAERKWVIALYLIGFFIALPVAVIVFVGVL
jgi:sodium-dependent phosphate cotransporter